MTKYLRLAVGSVWIMDTVVTSSLFDRPMRLPTGAWEHQTVKLEKPTTSSLTLALWPANSPDLNPVDCQTCWKLQERVYRSRIHDVDQLKLCLIEDWKHFQQTFIMKRSGVAPTSLSLHSSLFTLIASAQRHFQLSDCSRLITLIMSSIFKN